MSRHEGENFSISLIKPGSPASNAILRRRWLDAITALYMAYQLISSYYFLIPYDILVYIFNRRS